MSYPEKTWKEWVLGDFDLNTWEVVKGEEDCFGIKSTSIDFYCEYKFLKKQFDMVSNDKNFGAKLIYVLRETKERKGEREGVFSIYYFEYKDELYEIGLNITKPDLYNKLLQFKVVGDKKEVIDITESAKLFEILSYIEEFEKKYGTERLRLVVSGVSDE